MNPIQNFTTAFGSKPLSATHDLLCYRFQPKAKIGKVAQHRI